MTDTRAHEVIIIGSGFSGLGLAIALRRAGRDDFVVLEKAGELGGTWRENTYPGCACDVPSHMYSYSFEPNPDWSHRFSPQPEIRAYLRRCAAKYGVEAHVRYHAAMQSARFDDATKLWQVSTTAGDTYTGRSLVLAIGPLHIPAMPDIPGIGDFVGPAWHSAQWRHDVDLAGKRVAVIGTGASGAQLVPEVAKVAARLDVYQRTPPWVIPRMQEEYSERRKARYRRFPVLQRAHRRLIYWQLEAQSLGFARPRFMALGESLARRHLRRQVPDPALRAKLTPQYRMGCKRVIPSDDFYPTLTRDHVDLVTDPITRVTPDGVVTADGTHRPADVLICGTGFQVIDAVRAIDLTGRDGVHIQDAWRDGIEAYAGTTVAGFPNLFILLGPNTGLGHNSVVFMMEAQVRYVLQALAHLDRAATVEVRADRQAEYNRRIQARLASQVWSAGGCRSWYLDEQGVNRTIWPGFSWRFAVRLRRFDPADYVIDSGRRSTVGSTSP